MHSTKSFDTSSAVAASSGRLNAITPPNAEMDRKAALSRRLPQRVLFGSAAGIVVFKR